MNYFKTIGKRQYQLLLGCLLISFLSQNLMFAQNKISVLDKKITISLEMTSLDLALEKIRKEGGVSIYYDKNIVSKYNSKAETYTNQTIKYVLNQQFENSPLIYQASGNGIIVKANEIQKSETKSSKPGKISGIILDENGEPLPGATVYISELSKGAVTDIDGTFLLDNIAVGIYTIEVSFISYQKQQLTNVEILSGKNTPLNVQLKPLTTDIGEVTVSAEYKRETVQALYALQKKTVSLTDGISAEQIKQLPASDVAQVLKKVSGITIQNDKYVTVRGMSERYNNVQLNSSSLPSTEPNRRNFSFDIIPSSLVDNVVVHKTFSPELPGEFAGGLVNVNTISIPQETFLTVSVGTGFNTVSTGKDFYTTRRETADYFGGSNDRVWYNRTFDTDKYFSDFDLSEPGENQLKQIANIPNNWGLLKYKAQPKQSYSISYGKPLEINANNTIGLVIAGTYSHSEKIDDYWERTRTNLGDTTFFAYKYKFKTNIGAIANIAWKNKNGHRINFRNLYNRNFLHENTVKKSEDLDNPGDIYYGYYSTEKMNTLWQTRLDGEHNLLGENLVFDWFADYSSVDRVEPDSRNAKGQVVEEYDDMDYVINYDYSGLDPGKGLSIFANELNESKKNVGANLTTKFDFLHNEQKIKTGYCGSFRTSSFDQGSFLVWNNNLNLQALTGLSDVEMGNPEYYGEGKYIYTSITGNDENGQGYEGTQDIHVGYLMAEFAPLKKVGINGGVRIEHETMDVNTRQRIQSTEGGWSWVDSTITYTSTELLPSVTFIYKITPDIQFKAAYNKTLTRVDFKERSAFQYYDMEELGFMLGNGGLKSGYTQNYDLRLEWYPKPGEIISISAFHKYFINPIEKISYYGTGGNYTFMFFNLDDATTKGIEADLRKSFGFINNSSKILTRLYVSANLTLMKGEVIYNADKLAEEAQNLDYDEEDADIDDTRSRDLQGLSPFVYNAGLSYQGNRLGASVNLNHTGRTLVMAGVTMEQDEYNAPRNQLDAQISMKFLQQKMTVKFNASDLLHEDYIYYRNQNPDDANMAYDEDPDGLDYNSDYDWTLKRIKKGIDFSVSVSYKF